MQVSDYFAELYVAGRFAEAGWDVYFPHRDKGFDFIVSKPVESGSPIIRPVQVKGKYPTEVKTPKRFYGYVGKLTQTHPKMILAIPYFTVDRIPLCVAYLPFSQIKCRPDGETYRCEPASFLDGRPVPRRDFRRYLDYEGLLLIEGMPT
ncbi:MAG: hypothetical protein WCI73_15795, partial [Phycisphaerae bacterium]